MNLFFVIILGLIIGSFLNVCISRIPKHESIDYPPSHCDICKKRLKPLDLIPIISYLLFKGKCRYCGGQIDKIYPMVEFLNCILYVSIYLNMGLSLDILKFYVFASILIVLGVIDYKTSYVYSSTVVVSLVSGGIFMLVEFFYRGINPMHFISGGLIGFITVELVRVITKGIGNGDPEVVAVCGIFLGIRGVISTLLLSILIGGFIAMILLIFKDKKRTDRIPFVPFISIGAFISMIYGNEIINQYIRLILS